MTRQLLGRGDFARIVADLPGQVIDVNDFGDQRDIEELMRPFWEYRDLYLAQRKSTIRHFFWWLTLIFPGGTLLTLVTGQIGASIVMFLLSLAALGVYLAVRIANSLNKDAFLSETEKQYRTAVQDRQLERYRRWEVARAKWEAEEAARQHAIRASLRTWQEVNQAPSQQPYGVTAFGAEQWIRDWMIYMGAAESTTTQRSGDGGVDVASPGYIAQVKYTSNPVKIEQIRAHIGVAQLDVARRTPLFFASSGYPSSAISAADSVGMALFTFNVGTATVQPMNQIARFLSSYGFDSRWWPQDSK